MVSLGPLVPLKLCSSGSNCYKVPIIAGEILRGGLDLPSLIVLASPNLLLFL